MSGSGEKLERKARKDTLKEETRLVMRQFHHQYTEGRLTEDHWYCYNHSGYGPINTLAYALRWKPKEVRSRWKEILQYIKNVGTSDIHYDMRVWSQGSGKGMHKWIRFRPAFFHKIEQLLGERHPTTTAASTTPGMTQAGRRSSTASCYRKKGKVKSAKRGEYDYDLVPEDQVSNQTSDDKQWPRYVGLAMHHREKMQKMAAAKVLSEQHISPKRSPRKRARPTSASSCHTTPPHGKG